MYFSEDCDYAWTCISQEKVPPVFGKRMITSSKLCAKAVWCNPWKKHLGSRPLTGSTTYLNATFSFFMAATKNYAAKNEGIRREWLKFCWTNTFYRKHIVNAGWRVSDQRHLCGVSPIKICMCGCRNCQQCIKKEGSRIRVPLNSINQCEIWGCIRAHPALKASRQFLIFIMGKVD